MTRAARAEVPIEAVRAAAYRLPTDALESDGTFAWEATTAVVVEARAGGETALGVTYGPAATVGAVEEILADEVAGRDALAVAGAWRAMVAAVRNAGRPGIASLAVSAVDVALWDLKARLLGLPLAALLGQARASVPVYGSGGFTSYDDRRLSEQLGGWAAEGIRWVKLKVGREPERDVERVAVAREAVGGSVELMVDANGALDRKRALRFAEEVAGLGVTWLEEPVASDDLAGLRLLRDRAPAPVEIAAGEYGYELGQFRRMLEAGAVDVLQADATRCGGISGFLRAGALCEAFDVPLSAHTAPSVHLHVCLALPCVRHVEWFHDHVRVERLLFDGAVDPVAGELAADASRPGLGLELRRADAERFAV